MKKLNKTTTLKGISGKEYSFELYSFAKFDQLSDEITAEQGALYLFTKRYLKNGEFYHKFIYLGETSDISTRYSDHHKKRSIISHGSNCIGFLFADVNDDERKAMEKDILEAIDFPCNDKNN